MISRSSVRAAFLALLLALPAAAGGRPDVLVVSLDTTRADHLGCYGYGLETSPHIDALARSGIVFEGIFSHAVNTAPSHATLFTGLPPTLHGVRHNGQSLGDEAETLATALGRAGYRTGAFVSGFTMKDEQTGLGRGFDRYDDDVGRTERRARRTVDRALAWLDDQEGERPWFLFVHLFDPHGRYRPPKGFADRFRKGTYPALAESDTIPGYQQVHRDGRPVRDALEYIARYDGEIAYADREVGRLLEAGGDGALVVVTADHGETLVDRPYFFDHGARLPDEQIRVPLILRLPSGDVRGRRVGGLGQLTDVMPTVLSALGLPAPEGPSGRDLMPYVAKGRLPGGVVYGEARSDDARVADRGYTMAADAMVASVRDERFKLVRYPTRPGPSYELFDLAADPGEREDIADREPERVREMAGLIDAYLAGGGSTARPDLDDATREALEALGYVDPDP